MSEVAEAIKAAGIQTMSGSDKVVGYVVDNWESIVAGVKKAAMLKHGVEMFIAVLILATANELFKRKYNSEAVPTMMIIVTVTSVLAVLLFVHGVFGFAESIGSPEAYAVRYMVGK